MSRDLALTHRRSIPNSGHAIWGVGLGFFALAGLMASLPARAPIPLPEPHVVEASRIRPGGLRTPMADPPTSHIGGYAQQCSDCHKHFKNPIETKVELVQHTGLVFDHGMNDRCLNCHDRHDRDKLVGPGGTPLPYSRVIELCARCHGTVYRDWERGMHGKSMRSWDPSRVQRLGCTDCHDPHSPAYGDFEPLPAPSTLRMGDQHGHHHEPPRSPLQQWNPHH
jgi:hypothetical protein